MNDLERQAIEAGYPNAATARWAERMRVQREQETQQRRRAGNIAQEFYRRNQSGAESASTVFTIPPVLGR